MTRILNLHMEFVEGVPPTWRLVEVPEDTTLAELASIANQVFDDLPQTDRFVRGDGATTTEDKTLEDAFSSRRNRLDLCFSDDSNSLVFWNEGTAWPNEEAEYPRLVAGGEELLDERDPEATSTHEARPLENAKKGDWEAPVLETEKGIEMVERFLQATDLPPSQREAFEKLRESQPEVFAEFAWATDRISKVDSGASPRMRRPYHRLNEAGISIERGLIEQVKRTELYRSETAATGIIADLLAGMKCTEAIEPLVNLLTLEGNYFQSRYFIRYALADLDGPDFERVFNALENASPEDELNVIASLSYATDNNERLVSRTVNLMPDLDESKRTEALSVIFRHQSAALGPMMPLVDKLIDSIEIPQSLTPDDVDRLRSTLDVVDDLLQLARTTDGDTVELAAERLAAIEEVRVLVRDATASGAGTYRSETDVGRNDPCPCGSGKKYKKCCMRG